MIHNAFRDERSGPFVWTGIIGVTCLLLVLLEHMLWLVLPFIVGTVMYYILLGPMQRLLRAGFTRNVSATLVCVVFFGASALLLMAAMTWTAVPGGEADLRRRLPVRDVAPQPCCRGVACHRRRTAREHRRSDQRRRVVTSRGLAVHAMGPRDQRPDPELVLDPAGAHSQGQQLPTCDAPELAPHQLPNGHGERVVGGSCCS